MIHTVAIGGVGLLGGSLALALRRRKICRRIIGVGRSQARLIRARRARIIDDISTSPADGVCNADVVFVCTPVQDIIPWLKRAAPGLKGGALVMDVGSVKKSIVAPATRICAARGASFVGCHPMAGSEKTGFENSCAELYSGRVIAMTPVPGTCPDALRRAEKIWRKTGARTVRMSPSAHDEIAAATSHMPHLAACAVAAAVASSGSASRMGEMSGDGFRDTTRIAGSDARLWAGIFANNRRPVLKSLGRLRAQVAALERPLRRGGKNMERELQAALESSRRARERIFKTT